MSPSTVACDALACVRLRERSSSRTRERARPVVERVAIPEGDSIVTTALGIAAASWALLMALSPILQVREIVRRGSSEGISIAYFVVLLVGFALWVSYGIARHDLPLVVPNIVAFLVMGCTITVALRTR